MYQGLMYIGSNDGSSDNDPNEEEEGEDLDEAEQEAEDEEPDGEGLGEDNDDDRNDDGEEEEDDQEPDASQERYAASPVQRHDETTMNAPASLSERTLSQDIASFTEPIQSAAPTSHPRPALLLTTPSPRQATFTAPGAAIDLPLVRPEALTAPFYDIVPTIAAPHSTSINAVTATPDLRWVFSGGADGYIRKFNWVETANGKVMLTVAQRHPFVDSVTKAGVLTSYWENEEPQGEFVLMGTLFAANAMVY